MNEPEDPVGVASTLLSQFNAHLNKRGQFFLYSDPNLTAEMLKLHIFMWRKEWEKIHEDTDKWHYYYAFSRHLDQTLDSIQTSIMTSREHGLYTFFPLVKEHLDKFSEEKVFVEGTPRQYLNDFPLLDSFFETLNKTRDGGRNAWEAFPKEWRATEENLKNRIVQKWFFAFMQWCESAINDRTEEYNWPVDVAVSEFFPTVDPYSWGRILTFVFLAPYENRLEMFIEDKRGLSTGRVFTNITGPGDKDPFKKLEETQRDAEEESAKLAAALSQWYLPFFHAFQKIDSHIEGLESLLTKYTEDDYKQHKTKSTLTMFKKIKKYQANLKKS